MKCKSCGRDVPDNSIFCNWCGEKLLKERKKKDEIKVPTPKKLPSGNWWLYLSAEKQSVTEKTKDLCISKAKAIRAGFIESKKQLPKMTIGGAIDKMISDKQGVISPSTIRGYKIARKHGFQKYMNSDISAKIDWQEAITEESKTVSAKTVYNRWNVISAAMRYCKIDPPDVQLPKFKKGGQPYLDYEQIQKFIPAIRGKPCELAALLALHSLRVSELADLRRKDIIKKQNGDAIIRVSGVRVPDENNQLVEKETNKTDLSFREIPVVIPRLLELIPDIPEDEFIVQCNPKTIGRQINAVCDTLGFPHVAAHGLRRSFASLGYHLKWPELRIMSFGGWSDYKTVHQHYLQEAQKDKDMHSMEMEKFYEGIDASQAE